MSDRTMRAVVDDEYGGPEVLRVADVPRPEAGEDQVLVRAHAASVNQVDAHVRSGGLRLVTVWRKPLVPGCDFAGEVVAAGAKVQRLHPGDRVFGMLSPTTGGAYAEFVAVDADAAAPIPATLGWVEAAAAPVTAVTALQPLRDKAKLQGGGRVLVNGAAGGVGTFGVQLARVLGASTVVGTAEGKDAELLRGLGVDRVIDYDTTDFAKESAAYDVVVDAAGKSSYEAARHVLAPDGVYVTTLPDPKLALAEVTTLFRDQKAEGLIAKPNADDLRAVAGLMAEGRVRAVVDRTYPLDQAADAHRRLEEGHGADKVVLTVA